MADSEIRLRFSAQGIRQIRDDMRATGQEGTEAFAKIQTAVAKGAVTLKSAQKELEQYEAALKAMGHTDTTTFAQLSGVNRTFNPTQTGVPTYQGPQASAYSRGASAGQSNLAQRTLALTDAINPLAVAERKMSGAVAEADTLLAAGTIKQEEHAAAVALARKEFEDAEKAAAKLGQGAVLTSAQMMELGHSARSVADSMIAGRNPISAIAMESGRFGQVLGEGPGGVNASLKALGSLIMSPIGLLIGFGGAALAAAGFVGTLSRNIKEAGGEAESLERIAAQAGVTTEKLQQLHYAARQLDVDPSAVDRTLTSLNRSLGTAQNGGRGAKLVTQGFALAGIDPATLGQYHDAAAILPKVADGFAKAGDAATRAAIAKYLRLEPDAIPLLMQGGAALDRLSQAADHLGLVLDEGTVKSLASAKREMQDANEIIGVETTRALAGMDVGLANSMLAMAQWTNQLRQWISGTRDLVAGAEKSAGLAAGTAKTDLQGLAGWLLRMPGGGFGIPAALMGASLFTRGAPAPTAPVGQAAPKANGPKTKEEIDAENAALKIQNELNAELIDHSTHRLAVEQKIAAINDQRAAAGDAPIDKKTTDAWLAAADKMDAKPGQRKSDEAAKKAAAAADKAAEAQLEWNATILQSDTALGKQAEAVKKVADLRKAGAKIGEPEAAAYEATERAKGAADELRKSLDEAKLQREVTAALGGTTRETEHLEQAQELLARAIEGKIPLTEQQRQTILALGRAADEAAEKMKAMEVARAAVSKATADVQAVAPKTVDRVGRYDPAAALTQWMSQREAIYAASEAKIKEAEAERVAEGADNELQAAQKVAQAIAAIDVAYATESAKQILEIKKKSIEAGEQAEKASEDKLKEHIDNISNDIGSAVLHLAEGGRASDVGRTLAKQILEQILETFVSDPLVKLIKDELTNLTAGGGAGPQGGVTGLLGGALRFMLGGGSAPSSLTSGVASFEAGQGNLVPDLPSTPDISIPTVSIPGFASGTDSTGDGLYWVGENGPELMSGPGRSVMSAPDSMKFLDSLHSASNAARSLASSGAGSGASSHTIVVNNNTHLSADGADPAQLQRLQNQVTAHAKAEPQRMAAYFRAAGLK